MLRMAGLIAHGVIVYLALIAVCVAGADYLFNWGLLPRLDQRLGLPLWAAAGVDVALIAAFGLQHSIMARARFKSWWVRIVPEPLERSVYTLISSLALLAIFLAWQRVDLVVWDLSTPTARALIIALALAGWGLAAVAGLFVGPLDLFGLGQLRSFARKQPIALPRPFRAPGPYRVVRHPMYLGWIVGVFAAPTMTVDRLIFALSTTAYVLIGMVFEERDLTASDPGYAAYRAQVPAILPFRVRLRRRRAA